jgi:hypothetical protein
MIAIPIQEAGHMVANLLRQSSLTKIQFLKPRETYYD